MLYILDDDEDIKSLKRKAETGRTSSDVEGIEDVNRFGRDHHGIGRQWWGQANLWEQMCWIGCRGKYEQVYE